MKKNKKRIWTTSDSLFQPVFFFSFFLMKAGPSFNIYPVQTHTFHPHLINKTRRRRRREAQRHMTELYWNVVHIVVWNFFFLDIYLFWIWNIPRATAVNMEFFLLLFYPFFYSWYTQPHLSRCNVWCHQVRRRRKVFPKKKKKKSHTFREEEEEKKNKRRWWFVVVIRWMTCLPLGWLLSIHSRTTTTTEYVYNANRTKRYPISSLSRSPLNSLVRAATLTSEAFLLLVLSLSLYLLFLHTYKANMYTFLFV